MNERRRVPRSWLVALVLMLVWGAGAFGSPYPWAYTPLLITAVVLGAAGVLFGRHAVPTGVVVGLALVATAAAIQLIPMPPALLERISPASLSIHNRLTFAPDPSRWLPLTIDSNQTLLGLAFLGSFSILLTGCARLLDRESTRLIAMGITILGVLLAMVGIVQHGTFNGKIYGFWPLVQGGNPFGPYVNRNHFAGWMLMGIPLSTGLLAASVARGACHVAPQWRARVLWLSSKEANGLILLALGVLLTIFSLLLTLSRSGILALASGLVIVALLISSREMPVARRVAIIAYLAIVAIVAASWVGLEQIVQRFSEGDMSSVTERPAIWADTVRIIRDFWLAGTGFNTYGVATLFYQTSVPSLHLREAHNDYLQLAAEGGLLMGVPLLLAIAAFARSVRRRLREDVGSIWWIRIGAITGILSIAMQSLVEFSLQMPGNAALFTVLCAIALHDGRRG